MKRLVTLALVMLAAVSTALIPAGSASAHDGTHAIVIDGKMTIKDEDWPDSDDYAYPTFARTLVLTVGTASASARFTGCADEVRVVLDVTASHNPSPFADQTVSIQTMTRLYEGESCATTDLERVVVRTFTVAPYTTRSDQWSVDDDGDGVDILMHVRNAL